ncbi:uncharacterized protein ALTATR162_LOCUS626 [Alternaria atra]|uniref:Uncharacterized protein n=1 Tax=Alternaria atra TaxID=119953 RepID=A0A8J2MV58_9PLEO|nr:uncharacterized protein ALTATR162_LOCUS626 [Alternaria atra]CAG5140059.1 unnamed protein product [Alternaria atra]
MNIAIESCTSDRTALQRPLRLVKIGPWGVFLYLGPLASVGVYKLCTSDRFCIVPMLFLNLDCAWPD